MRRKTVWLTLLFFLAAGLFPLYLEAAQQIKRLGVTPIHKAKDLQAHQVYTTAKKVEKDLKAGFEKAGLGELFGPFMDQLKSAKPEKVQVPVGEQFQWMMFKKKTVRVAKDAVWAGKKPFWAFKTVVRHKEKDYEFIIPAVCFNVALKSVTAVQKPTPPPPPPPVKKEEAKPAPPPPPPVVKEEAKPAPPPPPPAPAPAKAEEPKKGFFVVDVGPMVRLDPSWFAMIRGGFMYRFHPKFAVTGMIGGAPLLDGPDNDYSAVLADAVFSFYPTKRFFIGAGIGMWSTEKKTDADVILQAGFNFTDKAKGPNFGMYFEARSDTDEIGDFLETGRIGIGFRMMF